MPNHEVTGLLVAWEEGDAAALEALIPLLYDELKLKARGYLRRERRDHTLNATALVNEAFLRLVDQRRVGWRGRRHFLAIAAQTMRRVLVDYARKHQAAKRGEGRAHMPLAEASATTPGRSLDLLALDQALDALAEESPRQARVVELRFFGGLTIAETAEVLDVAPATVKLDWQLARAWLFRRLTGEGLQ